MGLGPSQLDSDVMNKDDDERRMQMQQAGLAAPNPTALPPSLLPFKPIASTSSNDPSQSKDILRLNELFAFCPPSLSSYDDVSSEGLLGEGPSHPTVAEADVSRLPPEVLCQITRFLKSYEIVRLWLTGSSLLRFKMYHGGVTSVRHESTRMAVFPSKFPPLLRHFNRLLELEFVDIRTSLSEAQCSSLAMWALPTKNLVSLDLSHVQISLSLDFSSFLALKSLACPDEYSYSTLEVKYPPNITCLRCRNASIIPSSFSSFPKTLKSFYLSILHCSFVDLNDSSWKINYASFEHLETLDLSSPSFSQIPSFSGWCAGFPSSLTHLQLNYGIDGLFNTDDVFFLLPRQLSFLILRFPKHCAKRVLGKSLFHPLPRSLKHFEFTFGNNILLSADAASSLPESLTFLSLVDIVIHPTTTSFLPPSLTYLGMMNDRLDIKEEDRDDISLLPKTCFPQALRTVFMVEMSSFYRDLPRSITKLVLSCAPSSEQSLELGQFSTLWHLQLRMTYLKNPISMSLPDSLLSLDLSLKGKIKDGTMVGMGPGKLFPPNLTRLDFIFSSTKDERNHTPPEDWSEQLPPTLTSMELQMGSSSFGKSFAHLPRLFVATIRLIDDGPTENLVFYDGWYGWFPQALTSLNVEASKDILFWPFMNRLPRSLTQITLEFRSMDLVDKDMFAILPTSLTQMTLHLRTKCVDPDSQSQFLDQATQRKCRLRIRQY